MPAQRLIHLLTLVLLPHLPLTFGANQSSAGLAWANQLYVPMGGFVAPGTSISSYYTWSPEPVIPTPDLSAPWDVPFDFVPMLWGCSDDGIAGFNGALERNFRGVNLTAQREILGFNEPDLKGQADCTPERAAEVWKSTLEPLKARGYRLGSPAVTGGPGGKEWMQRWFAACAGGCNPDFVAVHWYDIDPRDFIEHLQDYYWTFGRPIWVTEYAVMNFTLVDPATLTYGDQASLVQIETFMDVTRNYMESVDWVERYFYFGAMYEMQGVNPYNTLFNPAGKARRTGALSPLGVQYARVNGSVDGNGTRSDRPWDEEGGTRESRSWSWAVLIGASIGAVWLSH